MVERLTWRRWRWSWTWRCLRSRHTWSISAAAGYVPPPGHFGTRTRTPTPTHTQEYTITATCICSHTYSTENTGAQTLKQTYTFTQTFTHTQTCTKAQTHKHSLIHIMSSFTLLMMCYWLCHPLFRLYLLPFFNFCLLPVVTHTSDHSHRSFFSFLPVNPLLVRMQVMEVREEIMGLIKACRCVNPRVFFTFYIPDSLIAALYLNKVKDSSYG